jgi:spermidine synthase
VTSPNEHPPSRSRVLGLHGALLLSGAAGLIYQSSWTRLLQRVFGVGDLAVATVLATFFLGLGLGNAIAARYVSRVRRPGRTYALLEVGVGLYALVSLAIVPGIAEAYGALGTDAGFATRTAVRFVLACVALLPPTMLMGATLPVLARASDEGPWSRAVTGLYTSNTLGAVLGAAVAGFVLVPRFGTRATVVVGAVASFAAAGLAAAALRGASSSASATDVAPSSVPADDTGAPGTTSLGLAAALSGLAGFAALGSEVVWTRILRIVVHGTTAAFAAMLVNYLLGIAAGAALARALSRRVHPATLLGGSQVALVVLTAIAMTLVPFAPRVIPILSALPDTVPHETWVIAVVSFALLFPLAVVLGTGLPSTWAMVERRSDAGRGAAVLLTANTLGGLMGSLLTGFGLIPALGTEATLLGLAGVNAAVAAAAFRQSSPRGADRAALGARVLRTVGPVAVLCLVVLAGPSLHLHFLLGAALSPVEAMVRGPTSEWEDRTVFLAEGRNTTVTVVRRPGSLGLYNDGRPESGFAAGDPGFGPELILLGGLPGVLAGSRRQAMVVGLGAGHTAAMALAAGFERVRVVELEEGVVAASRLLYDARGRAFPLDDPRAELVVDDARNQLHLTSARSLDAVISQPSHPWLAGSSALYTREFFQEVDRALTEDGVFGLWVNLFRMDIEHLRSVLATLVGVFPHVRAFLTESSSLVLMASRSPRPLTLAQQERLLATDAALPSFGPRGLGTVEALFAHQELDAEGLRRFAAGGTIIEDDRPLLELELASLPPSASLDASDLDRAFASLPWSTEEVNERVLLARIEAVQYRPLSLDRIEPLPNLSAFVRGRLREARGDVDGALRAYDDAGTPDARLRAAELRYAAGANAALLAMEFDGSAPDVYFAAALASPVVPAHVLARAGEVDSALARFVVAAAAGCDTVASLASSDAQAVQQYAEAEHIQVRCALLRGDRDSALAAEMRAWRARSALAANWVRQGEEALTGHNGGLAWMHFRHALRIYPTATRASVGLATLHHRDGRTEEARAVLLAALAATSGLDEARARILQGAAALGLDLGVAPEDATTSPSSASTVSPGLPAPVP